MDCSISTKYVMMYTIKLLWKFLSIKFNAISNCLVVINDITRCKKE